MEEGTTHTNKVIVTVSLVVGLLGLVIYFMLLMQPRVTKRRRRLPLDAMPEKCIITCDAGGCSNHPSMKCGKCNMVYYCGRDCQKQHWKYHKSDCKTAVEKIQVQFDLNDNAPDTSEMSIKKDTECSICLRDRDNMDHPIVLKNCKHVFCVPCLRQYQEVDLTETSSARSNTNPRRPCPCCRAEIKENVRESVIAKALLYAARASRTGVSQEDKLKACQLAVEALQSLGKPTSDQDVLQANTICGHIAVTKGDYQDALKIFEQNERILTKLMERKRSIDALLERGRILGSHTNDDDDLDDATYEAMQQIQNEIMALMAQGVTSNETDLISCRLELANIRMEMQEWDMAKTIYKQIMTDYPEQEMLTPPQTRQIFMGFARCLYEEGNYEGSINMGEATITMNRHFPGIHKYVALSYRAKGDLKQAQTIMGRAVLYETPWDPANVARTRELWVQLMEEEE
jgi:tetratricopeptide (TPR) repeat protein